MALGGSAAAEGALGDPLLSWYAVPPTAAIPPAMVADDANAAALPIAPAPTAAPIPILNRSFYRYLTGPHQPEQLSFT